MTESASYIWEPWRVSVGLFVERAVDLRPHSLALGVRIECTPWVIGVYILLIRGISGWG